MIYSSKSIKGSKIAINCFKRFQKKFSPARLIAFGMEEFENLPEGADFFLKPDQQKICHIYNRCDAWLFTSTSEGFGLPVLEAMACRTPVIGTRCGAAPDLLESGGGVLIDVNKALLSNR